jgi:hypothetical protein
MAAPAAASVPPVARKQRAPRVAAARPPERAAPAQLRLEGMVIPVPRAALLRVSTEMHSQPAADASQRSAAAMLWQAINAPPQEWLRSGERLRTLENEIAMLRELSLKHRHELARLRELPQASAPSALPGWPWALALVAAVGAALAFLRRHRGEDGRLAAWAAPSQPETDLDHLDSQLAPSARVAGAAMPSTAAPVSVASAAMPFIVPPQSLPAASEASLPAAARELDPIEFELPVPSAETPAPARPAAPAPTGGADSPRIAALSAALQEAEFLVSIGYAAKAVDVLRAHLEDTRQPSALAVLELLQLCRDIGDAEGVAATQDAFRALFGEEPPPPGANSGLEACEPALARIMAAWPDAQVLGIIEQLLFSPPLALGGFPGLHAWRDLLWLHGLACDTLRGADAREPIAASAEGTEEMTLERLAQIGVDSSPRRFAVDLDLSPVDTGRHRVLDLQAVPRLPPVPDFKLVPAEPPASQPPKNYEDFFEAAMAAEGRDLYLQR